MLSRVTGRSATRNRLAPPRFFPDVCEKPFCSMEAFWCQYGVSKVPKAAESFSSLTTLNGGAAVLLQAASSLHVTKQS
jgi:hypothetical protein